jgi:hypothetical protein
MRIALTEQKGLKWKTMSEIAPQEKDLALKEREVVVHERELDLKDKELRRSKWLNPVAVGLFAATVGLIGNIGVAFVNNQNTQTVERLRAQSDLVVEAIKTNNDTNAACRNLVFLVQVNLLDDVNHAISKQCASAPPGPPTLPASSNTSREVSTLPARVYFILADNAQRQRAENLASLLTIDLSDLPLLVPGISLAKPGSSPNMTELRFVRDVDEPEADRIAATLSDLLGVPVQPKNTHHVGADRPRHFELWWSSSVAKQ